MLITRTVTKKILENIVHESFSAFGNATSSSLLDSLKFLGFHYATNAGISINIEDLKTPKSKEEFLQKASSETSHASEQWIKGLISDTERFQSIMDSWNSATESLKERIVYYYQKFDPTNNLYIMAFSGARGNMSQVRQLVGMRGLMADQEGNIIDLPIQRNFREGLSSIDYIISSYGARKGIVDTSLKTAESGYLTRRLIYLAQDLVIREIDCQTNQGVIVSFNKNSAVKSILGRVLLNARDSGSSLVLNEDKNIPLTENILNRLKRGGDLLLKVRSPLTCQSHGSVCQNCYGWDLGQRKLISLGDAVGITAAQSIGEPGTQLTMRTFHTGGIFTSEMVRQTLAPFSGKVQMPLMLNAISYRTTHGTPVLKIQQEAILTLIHWTGVKEKLSLEIGSFLYVLESSFVKKGQLISEHPQSSIVGIRRLKPIYAPVSGEIQYDNSLVKSIAWPNAQAHGSKYVKPDAKVSQENGVLWLMSGKIFLTPEEAFYHFPKKLNKGRAFASIKLIAPCGGIFTKTNDTLFIDGIKKSVRLDLSILSGDFKNCKWELALLMKKYQYLDKHSIIGILHIYPEYEGKIYAARKKFSEKLEYFSKRIVSYFLITESDVWKMHSDHANAFFTKIGKYGVELGEAINSRAITCLSGFPLEKQGLKWVFQKVTPIFLSKGALLHFRHGDLVLNKELLATLVTYTQQTDDIVQGLPKIEELIEARIPEIKATLASFPGVMLGESLYELSGISKEKNDVTLCVLSSAEKRLEEKKRPKIQMLHSPYIWINSAGKRCSAWEIFRAENLLDVYESSEKTQIKVPSGSFLDLGEPLTDGPIDPHDLLRTLFCYHGDLDGPLLGVLRSLSKFQLILVNSIQAIYQSQGVNIANKHLEVIVRQLTSRARIVDGGSTALLKGERISLALIYQIHKAMLDAEDVYEIYRVPEYVPLLSPAKTSALAKDGFLSSAGFQETKRVLTSAAIEGKSDWLRGLKECVIAGRLMPAGSAYLNYKNFLDQIYNFKD